MVLKRSWKWKTEGNRCISLVLGVRQETEYVLVRVGGLEIVKLNDAYYLFVSSLDWIDLVYSRKWYTMVATGF